MDLPSSTRPATSSPAATLLPRGGPASCSRRPVVASAGGRRPAPQGGQAPPRPRGAWRAPRTNASGMRAFLAAFVDAARRALPLLPPPEAIALEAPPAPAPAAPLQVPETTPHGNQLPPSVHDVLEPETMKPGRVLVVGDVHGCFDELQDLLKACDYDRAVDNLIFVGDLVNKGPLSAECVRFAREEGAIAVRGNHDDAALSALRMLETGALPPKQAAKYAWTRGLSAADIAWLDGLPFTVSIPSHGAVVVHAGLVPGCPLSEQRLLDMYKMRDVLPAQGHCDFDMMDPHLLLADPERPSSADRRRVRRAAHNDTTDVVGDSQTGDEDGPVCEDPPCCSDAPWRGSEKPVAGVGRRWASQWRGPECVFFGHDAARQIQLESHAVGLDSGVVYGKRLTAAALPPASAGGGADLMFHPDPARKAGLLVSVPARAVYQEPKKPKAPKKPKGSGAESKAGRRPKPKGSGAESSAGRRPKPKPSASAPAAEPTEAPKKPEGSEGRSKAKSKPSASASALARAVYQEPGKPEERKARKGNGDEAEAKSKTKLSQGVPH